MMLFSVAPARAGDTTHKPQAGDRYVVATDFRSAVLISWRAPFTSGSERTIPAGLEFVVDYDPPPQATAVGATPTEYKRWGPVLVDEKDRSADKYGGYYLVIPFVDLSAHCRLLERH